MIRALTTRRPEMAPFVLLLPAVAIMLFVVAYQVWQIGLRHYQGTGS